MDGSADAERTGRLLALTARAHADLADLDPPPTEPGRPRCCSSGRTVGEPSGHTPPG